jgi:hypothetical protein
MTAAQVFGCVGFATRAVGVVGLHGDADAGAEQDQEAHAQLDVADTEGHVEVGEAGHHSEAVGVGAAIAPGS